MRGKQVDAAERLQQERITPADAGKTAQPAFAAENLGDHPRGCGENNFAVIGDCGILGSPPRMRGKQERAVGIVQQSRITPADAGKTVRILNPYGAIKDHPRGCGENPLECYSVY